jgi:acyl-homoserine lactone acylase PvdQ
VPNIYPDSGEVACFALGYAQVENRPVELFNNYRMAVGRLAGLPGSREVAGDLRLRVARHVEASRKSFDNVSPPVWACNKAWV